MTRKDRVYFAAAAGVIAYGVSWLVAGIVDQPLLWLDPLTTTWHFQTHAPTSVSMDWYGRVAQGLAAGALAGGAAWFALGRTRANDKNHGKGLPWHAILGGWAAAIMLICMFLYAYTLANRTVYPPAPGSSSPTDSP